MNQGINLTIIDKIKVEKIIIEIMKIIEMIITEIEMMRIEKIRKEKKIEINMIRRIKNKIGKKRDIKLI